jgi:hypothetical protein
MGAGGGAWWAGGLDPFNATVEPSVAATKIPAVAAFIRRSVNQL